jgi:hypothetical protein
MASPQAPPVYVAEVAGTNVYTPQSTYVNQYYAYTPSSGTTSGTTTSGTTTSGAPLGRTATYTADTAYATTGTTATGATTSPAITSAAATTAAKTQISEAPPEDSTNTVIYVVVAVAVLGAVGGGAYLVMLNGKF